MNKDFQAGWWLVVITIIMMIASPIMLLKVLSPADTAVWEYGISLLGELALLIPAAIGILYLKLTRKNENNFLAFNKAPLVIIPLSVLTVLGAQYFITYMTLPLQALLIAMFGMETATTQMLVPSNVWEFLLAFAALCIVAPVVEEILCRGVLIRLFERYGMAIALLSSSCAFAMLHFEARSFIQIFFIGMLLGVFRICTGSVIPCIIMHSANNLLSLCQLTFFSEADVLPLAICIMLAVSFIPMMYITFVKCNKYLHPESISFTKEKTGFSLGACLCVATFAIYNAGMLIEHIINL